MKRKNLKGNAACVEGILEKDRVNIHKNKDISLDRNTMEKSLDRNTMEKIEGERYPERAIKKEFEVSLHFSEEVQGVSAIDEKWKRILKDTYIKHYLEERKRKEKNR